MRFLFRKLVLPFVCSLIALGLHVSASAQAIPRPDHVVVVMFENTSYGDMMGNTHPVTGAPYINSLRGIGANMTRSTGTGHPTDPNYVNFFSGSNQGITGNSDPRYPSGAQLTTPNLAAQLIAAGYTFGNYQQDLKSNSIATFYQYAGQTYNTMYGPNGQYFVDENPVGFWIGNGLNQVPVSVLKDMKDLPADFSQLPTVSLWHAVEDHDGHQGYPNDKVHDPDNWMKTYLSKYVQWAMTHNSLLIITYDESYTESEDPNLYNHIPTLFIGPMVKAGDYADNLNHFGVLRTIEDMYGLPYAGAAASATPLRSIWQTSVQPVVSITSPTLLSNFAAPASVAISASVIPNGHTISKVQFFNGTTLLGEATSAPYNFNWTNVTTNYYGYSLSAKVIYDNGASVSSAPVPIAVYPTSNLRTGLLAYLNLDSNLSAQSGTSINGTKIGPNPARYVPGKFGQAASFSNTGSLNDWAISLGNLDANYAGDFTASIWVKTNSTQDESIFGNKNYNANANVGWLFSTKRSGGTVNWNGAGGSYRAVGVDPAIYDGNWHMLTMTVNRSYNQVTTYIDGVQFHQANITPSGTASFATGLATLIGGSGAGAYAGKADIDEVAMWTRCLSPIEISTLFGTNQALSASLGNVPDLPALTLNTANPVHGNNISVSFTTPTGKASAKNWIGIYPAGVTPSGNPAASDWVYVNSNSTTAGSTLPANGTVTLGAKLAAGNYVVWFLYNDGYSSLGNLPFTLK